MLPSPMLSNKAAKIKVLLLENIHSVAREKLESAGFEVAYYETALDKGKLLDILPQYDVVGIRSKTKISEEVLKECNKLMAIGTFCIGTDQVDLEEANHVGVPVFNAPYSNTRSVAELVIAQMINLSRRIGDRNTKAHQGIWDKSAKGSNEVRGKTLGIIGYGHIGSQLSILGEALGLQVIYYDIIKKLPLGNARACDSLQELLQNSDFVSLHVPDTPETRNMISSSELRLMKEGAYLINASRGSVVDIPTLADGLHSGKIAGAAVDVFPKEPKNNKEAFESALQGLPNVLLSPHIGGSTEEAQKNIGFEVADSLIHFINTGTTVGAVNFPNLDIPVQKNEDRIINIHKNVPGVLRDVNQIVTDLGANIKAQYLSTDNNIGYLVVDMVDDNSVEAYEKISQLETSIKTRLLRKQKGRSLFFPMKFRRIKFLKRNK